MTGSTSPSPLIATRPRLPITAFLRSDAEGRRRCGGRLIGDLRYPRFRYLHAILSTPAGAREGPAGGLDVLAARVTPDDRLAEVRAQGVAELFHLAVGRRLEPARGVGHVDQVEPDGGVADQRAEC